MGDAPSGPGQVTRASKRGSEFSDKQIAHAVKDGKAIRAVLPDGSAVIGYVFGMDSFHWGIVTMEGQVHLVHKTAPCLTITEHLLERQGPEHREVIDPMVAPFREYVMRTHFKSRP